MGLIDRFITSFRSEDRGIAEPPGLVQNDDGTVDYVRPDGSRTPIGNGGSSPARNVGQTELDFSGLVVNNATVPVPFTFGNGDATMIDLTDPAVPKPVAAGIYAYTLIVSQTGGGDGAAFTATLVVDDDYYSITEIVGMSPNRLARATAEPEQPHRSHGSARQDLHSTFTSPS